MMLENYSTVH